MIKEYGAVREPRGLTWQNWATSCKDAVIKNPRSLIIVGFVVVAALGGSLYLRHNSSGYAKQADKPQSSGTELNLNDSTSAEPTMASVPSTAASASQSTNNAGFSPATVLNSVHGVSSQVHAQLKCNQVAATNAKLAHDLSMKTEDAYHAAQMTLMSTAGVATKLLDRSVYDAQVAKENTRHDSAKQSVDSTLQTALTNAHCS